MAVSGCQTVQELYTVVIPWPAIKEEHSSKTDILKNMWYWYLYTALRTKETIYFRDVEEELVQM
jgi:hypothetical protein